MKAGIMQPYFFPYLGYFSLIKNTDKFILLDSVQFIKRGWIHRNRILHPTAGWSYIRVPLVGMSQKSKIEDVRIDNSQQWKERIFGQLYHYKKTAPRYHQVVRLLEGLFEDDYDSIVALNRKALSAVCQFLHIEKDLSVFSEMNLSIAPPKAADEWALNICKSVCNVSEYWNPPGGQAFYDRGKFEKAGISLKFLRAHLPPYDQRRDKFEPGLSIMDPMMFLSVEQINDMLDDYELC